MISDSYYVERTTRRRFMTLLSEVVENDGKRATVYVSAGFDPRRGWNSYSFDLK